jgi:hypothetical protein
MRTVHETEALRPSDPVPKHHSSNPQNKSQRVKLTFKGLGEKAAAGAANGNGIIEPPPKPEAPKSNTSAPASPMTGPSVGPPGDLEYEHSNIIYLPAPMGSSQEYTPHFPPDINFTDEELSLPPPQLLRVLKSQLQWALQDGEELRKEVDELDARRKKEWTAKELVLENSMEAELATTERKQAARGIVLGQEDQAMLKNIREDIGPATGLEISGVEKLPWWREADALATRREADGDVQMEEIGRPVGEPVVKMEGGLHV